MAEKHYRKFDADTFKALTKKRPMPWIRDALIDWGIISATLLAAGLWNHPIGYIASVIILGNRQHALAILGHDGTHFTISKSKKLNDLVTNLLAFWSVGLTASGYRNLHFKHHKHTNTENDPELMHRGAKAPQWDLPITLRKVMKLATLDLVGYSLSDYIMIVMFAQPDKKRSYLALAAFHVTFITASILCGLWWVPALWYGALTTTFMMFFRLRTWLEHQGSDDTHILHLNLLEGIILSPHNAWYHYEHHHWPNVSYSLLPKLRKLTLEKPAMSLRELLIFYKNASRIPSGTALKRSDTQSSPANTNLSGNSQITEIIAA